MFAQNLRKSNPLADSMIKAMSDEPPKTRFDEGVELYWAEKPCPEDPEGKRGWEEARGEVEYGHRD